MKKLEFAPSDAEPIKQYEKAKIQIVDFKSVYIICGSSSLDEGWDDDGDIEGDDDDYYDGDE